MSTSPEPATRSRSAVPAGHPAHLLRELVRRELDLSAVFEPYEREERASRPIDGRRPLPRRGACSDMNCPVRVAVDRSRPLRPR